MCTYIQDNCYFCKNCICIEETGQHICRFHNKEIEDDIACLFFSYDKQGEKCDTYT